MPLGTWMGNGLGAAGNGNTWASYAWDQNFLYVAIKSQVATPQFAVGGLVRLADIPPSPSYISIDGVKGKNFVDGLSGFGIADGKNGTEFSTNVLNGGAITLDNSGGNGGDFSSFTVAPRAAYTQAGGETFVEMAIPIYSNWLAQPPTGLRTLHAGDVIAEYLDVADAAYANGDIQNYVTNSDPPSPWSPFFFSVDQDLNTMSTQIELVDSSVPEPASLSLLTLGGMILLRRRARIARR